MNQAAFEIAIRTVLAWEGGYSNDPMDAGGETRWGISRRAYPHEDIANLTRERAVELYLRDYWLPAGCDVLPSAIAIAVFDSAVNQGVRTAVTMLQMCLGVKTDGIVGSQTISAARNADPEKVLLDFFARRALRYAVLPTFERFGFGWMRRTFAVHKVCVQVLPLP